MKYMTHSIASTTWVALNRSRICFTPELDLVAFACLLLLRHRPARRRGHAERQVLTTFRCPGEFVVGRSSSDCIAASTPPARCGTAAAASPLSTADKAPIQVKSLH